MMSALEIALGFAALLIGATGTFSPCGLSVIDTIGPTGHTVSSMSASCTGIGCDCRRVSASCASLGPSCWGGGPLNPLMNCCVVGSSVIAISSGGDRASGAPGFRGRRRASASCCP